MKCPICENHQLQIINANVLYACPKCGLMSKADIKAWKKRHPINNETKPK